MSLDQSGRSRVAVIGGNGGIGKKVVELALQLGHFVRALVRDPTNLTFSHPNLEVIRGDVMDLVSLRSLFDSMDVVVSAIGKNSIQSTTLYSKGSENIIQALAFGDIRRVFFISASGIDVNPTHSFAIRLFTRFVLQKILRHMYADLHRMEQIIKQSELDWTIVRPPRLTDELVTGKYRIAINQPLNNPWIVSRSNVAHYIVRNLKSQEILRSTIEISE